jgi:hypothetical protein
MAIAITLFVAASTSALGAIQNIRSANRRDRIGAAIGLVMAVWFIFAGVWLLLHE